jgi:hypothetical protein
MEGEREGESECEKERERVGVGLGWREGGREGHAGCQEAGPHTVAVITDIAETRTLRQ